MACNDLREWIELLEREGELARVKTKVDWNLEIGGITQEVFDKEGPALLFEDIKDYDNTACRKLFTGSLATYPRIALMLGLPKNTSYKEIIRIWRERAKKRVKPVIVSQGPVKENILKGDDVDLFQFPAPLWHDRDGGRYIGTFDGVITKHHDNEWMNVGLYRRMIHDKNKTGITFPIGQHAWQHWRSWRQKGKNLPVACAIGWDPILPAVASSYAPPDVSEYEVMGALRGKPVELIKCETSDLLVPASAEIVLEGEVPIDVDSFIMEGPFGEYTGYYGTIPGKRPVFHVKCITFRNDPILQGTLEGVPINEDHRIVSVHHSASIWDLLEERMTGIKGVNVDPSTGWANVFVQIDNSYFGQVHQVASNIWSAGISTMVGKNVFVFDPDVDIYDLRKIMWAFAYRVIPGRDIIEFPGWISALDPVAHPKDKFHDAVNKGNRLLIDATKPLDWPRSDKLFGERFAPIAYPDQATMEKVRGNWERYGIKIK